MSDIDFSQFKKTAQDKHRATLRHPDGHEITIAIGGLNAAMKKKLHELPLHQAKPEGPIEDIDEDSPAEITETPETPQAPEAPEAPGVADSVPAANMPATAQQPTQAPASPAPPAEAPAPAPAPQVQEQMPVTPDQHAQKMLAENAAFSNDLSSGHIAPKTYHDLYEKKDTLGKIGTLFGLLVSGAGSGLTGQSNAVLDMMNKEIERDFEAQKAREGNKQNWYKLALEHERNLPENALKSAEAAKVGSEADYARFRNAEAGVTDTTATLQGKNYSTIGMMQTLQDYVNRMPPGPARDQTQLKLTNEVAPYFMNQIMQRTEAAAVNKVNGAQNNPMPVAKSNRPSKEPAEPGKHYDAFNQARFNAMVQKGKFAPPGSPGAIDPKDIDEVRKEGADLTTNRNNLADAVDSFHALAKLKNAGQAPLTHALPGLATSAGGILGSIFGPAGAAVAGAAGHFVGGKAGESLKDYFERNRAIQIEALKSRLGRDMSDDAKNALVNSILPSWTDTPESMKEAHRKLVQHFESNPAESNTKMLDFYKLKNEMPRYEFNPTTDKNNETSGKNKRTGAQGGW